MYLVFFSLEKHILKAKLILEQSQIAICNETASESSLAQLFKFSEVKYIS